MKSIYYILILLLLPPCFLEAKETERVYIQTDKNFYLAGETIWLKMYVTDINALFSPISKIGYVEVTNYNDITEQVKIELKEGVGNGWLSLPTSLPNGTYDLIGYTRYMQNEGEEVFFKKNIRIFNALDESNLSGIEFTSTQKPGPDFHKQNTIGIQLNQSHYSTRDKASLTLKELPAGSNIAISITLKDSLSRYSSNTLLNWKSSLSYIPSNTNYTIIPEYEGAIITGKIKSDNTNNFNSSFPVSFAIPGNTIRFFSGKINEKGEITFYTDNLLNVNEVVLTTGNSSEESYHIELDSPFFPHTPTTLPMLILNEDYKKDLLQRSMVLQSHLIYQKDIFHLEIPPIDLYKIPPYKSYLLEEYTRFNSLEETILEYISRIQVRKRSNKRIISVRKSDNLEYTHGNSLVLLDGIPVYEHDYILNYNVHQIKRIDVYSGTYIFGSNMYEGMMALYTQSNNLQEFILPDNSQLIDYTGTQPVRKFTYPDYSIQKNKSSRLPDFRHTLYWEPTILNKEKTSVYIEFCTSDLTGEFTVTVEGISKEGKVIYAQSNFYVENK